MAFKRNFQPKLFHDSKESHLHLSGSSPFQPWLPYLGVCGELPPSLPAQA